MTQYFAKAITENVHTNIFIATLKNRSLHLSVMIEIR